MLEINLPLVVLTAVIFLGLIAVLNSILYKPLLKFIDARNDAIKNDEESASKNTSDLGVYEAQIEQLIATARNEAGKIKQEAINAIRDNSTIDPTLQRKLLEDLKNGNLETRTVGSGSLQGQEVIQKYHANQKVGNSHTNTNGNTNTTNTSEVIECNPLKNDLCEK